MIEHPTPLLAVGHSDDAIVLTTRTGAQVCMPLDDALDLTSAIIQACNALIAHRQTIAEIDSLGA